MVSQPDSHPFMPQFSYELYCPLPLGGQRKEAYMVPGFFLPPVEFLRVRVTDESFHVHAPVALFGGDIMTLHMNAVDVGRHVFFHNLPEDAEVALDNGRILSCNRGTPSRDSSILQRLVNLCYPFDREILIGKVVTEHSIHLNVKKPGGKPEFFVVVGCLRNGSKLGQCSTLHISRKESALSRNPTSSFKTHDYPPLAFKSPPYEPCHQITGKEYGEYNCREDCEHCCRRQLIPQDMEISEEIR